MYFSSVFQVETEEQANEWLNEYHVESGPSYPEINML